MVQRRRAILIFGFGTDRWSLGATDTRENGVSERETRMFDGVPLLYTMGRVSDGRYIAYQDWADWPSKTLVISLFFFRFLG